MGGSCDACRGASGGSQVRCVAARLAAFGTWWCRGVGCARTRRAAATLEAIGADIRDLPQWRAFGWLGHERCVRGEPGEPGLGTASAGTTRCGDGLSCSGEFGGATSAVVVCWAQWPSSDRLW
uniref:Uncharacterized protein n=1 Tax=Arundo donax TaxID=35708 RepID=A0A0A8Y591_ARUDO